MTEAILRDLVTYDIAGAAYFRRNKAEQFPDDLRNQRSAEHLAALSEYVLGNLGDPELLEAAGRLEAAYHAHNQQPENGLVPGDSSSSSGLSRYGFDQRVLPPKDFLLWLLGQAEEDVIGDPAFL